MALATLFVLTSPFVSVIPRVGRPWRGFPTHLLSLRCALLLHCLPMADIDPIVCSNLEAAVYGLEDESDLGGLAFAKPFPTVRLLHSCCIVLVEFCFLSGRRVSFAAQGWRVSFAAHGIRLFRSLGAADRSPTTQPLAASSFRSFEEADRSPNQPLAATTGRARRGRSRSASFL